MSRSCRAQAAAFWILVTILVLFISGAFALGIVVGRLMG